MSHRLVTRAAAALLPAAIMLPAAAHAERLVVRDPARDVVRLDLAASEAADEEVVAPAPGDTSTDIKRVVVDHRRDVLEVRVEVRALRSSYLAAAEVALRTEARSWGVVVFRSGTETFTSLTRGKRETSRRCGGLITTVDMRADEMVVSVPTSCLEDPRWVRVGVGLFSGTVAPGRGGLRELVPYWDEAGVTGFEDDDIEARGPRIRRG